MSRKTIVLMALLTAANAAMFVINVSPAARAALAGASYEELMSDANFVRAVKAVVDGGCGVNVDLAKINCR